jgi:hypothetical protein
MAFMTDHPNKQKHVESEQHADAVRRYLAAGGKIQSIPRGVMKSCEASRKSGDFSINGVDRKKRFNQAK